MNGPTVMYKLKPVFKLAEELELPKCMYKMKNIQGSNFNLGGAQGKASKSNVQQPAYSKQGFILACEEKWKNIGRIVDVSIAPEVALLETRQESILVQLAELKAQIEQLKSDLKKPAQIKQMGPTHCEPSTVTTQQTPSVLQSGLVHDIVINANPKYPPYAVLAVKKLLGNTLQMRTVCHVHSSVTDVPDTLRSFFGNQLDSCLERSAANLNLTLVWKNVGPYAELVVSPMKQTVIQGEVNILRYLLRLQSSPLNYEMQDAGAATEIDTVLDGCHRLILSRTNKERQAFVKPLNSRLAKSQWLVGDSPSVADVAVWSTLKQIGLCEDVPSNVQKWLQRCAVQFDA